MKKVLFFCMIFLSANIFAQELDGVYLRKYPNKHIFISKHLRIGKPARYEYVYLKEDSTIIFISTTAGIIQDKYRMVGDSIYFEYGKINDLDPGILKNGKLYIFGWAHGLKKAKLPNVKKYIKDYGNELKRWNICFQNGYAVPCR